MAEVSVTQWNGEDQTAQGDDWEEQSYLEGCAYAREQARRRLKAPDDELLRRKPRGLRVEGFRERTLVTRFGEVAVRRGMYSVWEGVSLEWGRQYALAEVKLFVVGGDGANRIRRGVEELGSSRRAVFQLDGFHLACVVEDMAERSVRPSMTRYAQARMGMLARGCLPLRRPRAKRPSATESMSAPTSPSEWTGAAGCPTLHRTRGLWEPWSPMATSSRQTE